VKVRVATSIKRRSYRQQALENLGKLPSMPASAARLLARLSQRNCELGEVAEMVEQDPVLSAQVLQAANSAAFNRAQQIESVRHAIVMVGVGTIRKFALVRTVSNLFSRRRPARGFSLTRFNLHAVAVGVMMELLADEVPMEDRDGAFLAGLLHDVGALLIAVSLPEQYEDVLAVAAVSGRPLESCEQEVLGTNHAELSALAMEQWGLAEAIQVAAAHHHEPDSAALCATGSRVPLGLALYKADLLVDALGMSMLPAPPTLGLAPGIEFEGHAINQKRLFERFAEEWKSIGLMLR